MQPPSSKVSIPTSHVSGKDAAASDVIAPSELHSAYPTGSMPLQPVATPKPPSLPDASTSAGQQAAAKQEAVSGELRDVASDKALRVPQGVAGGHFPQGSCAPDSQCRLLYL